MPREESNPLGTPRGKPLVPIISSTQSITDLSKIDSSPQPLRESENSAASIVQKAKAILEEELQKRAIRHTGTLGKISPLNSLGLEPPLVGPNYQISTLYDPVLEVPESPIEPLTKVGSEFANMGDLKQNEIFPSPGFLKPPPPVIPGHTGTITIWLINDDSKETMNCSLQSTDLCSQTGNKIPAEHIHISSSSIEIGPKEEKQVRIDFFVPIGSPPGNYQGMLQINEETQGHAMLRLTVAP